MAQSLELSQGKENSGDICFESGHTLFAASVVVTALICGAFVITSIEFCAEKTNISDNLYRVDQLNYVIDMH